MWRTLCLIGYARHRREVLYDLTYPFNTIIKFLGGENRVVIPRLGTGRR